MSEKQQGPTQRQLEALIASERFYTVRYVLARITEATIYVSLFWFSYLAIEQLAGTSTKAMLIVKGLGESSSGCTLAFTFGIGGVFYGHRQRKLKGDTVQRLQDRIRQLEKIIDPKRTSAALTDRGDTIPEKSHERN